MSIDKLVETLKREASNNEERTLTEARAEADTITASAKKEAEKIDEEIKVFKKEYSKRRQSYANSIKKLIDAKEKTALENSYITAVKDSCGELFEKFMKQDEYLEMLRSEFNKIDDELEDIGELRGDADTSKALEKLKTGLKIINDKAINRGFVAVSGDDSLRVYCTFDGRLEKLWSRVAPEYVKKIAAKVENEF